MSRHFHVYVKFLSPCSFHFPFCITMKHHCFLSYVGELTRDTKQRRTISSLLEQRSYNSTSLAIYSFMHTQGHVHSRSAYQFVGSTTDIHHRHATDFFCLHMVQDNSRNITSCSDLVETILTHAVYTLVLDYFGDSRYEHLTQKSATCSCHFDFHALHACCHTMKLIDLFPSKVTSR
jgi:hypothetical protein